MRKIYALMIFGSAIMSIYILNFIDGPEIITFLNTLPTIIGILLATTLTSLAIILGMMGNNELTMMKKYEKIKGRNYYKNIINNLKWDVYFVFFAFIISSISRIFLNSTSTYKCLFVIGISLLVVSFIVINDLIQGLFHLNEARYEMANFDASDINILKK